MSTAGPQTIWWALFSLRGRIRRSTFAWGSLLLVALIWVTLSQTVFAVPESGQQAFWALAFVALSLASVYCLVALAVKRIHDIGFSGWWVLLGFITALYVIGFFLLCFWPGEQTENAFGPPPVSTG